MGTKKRMMNINMNTNNNKLILKITKNENININIDRRILPLFSTPILLKKINEKKRNKYNYNIINPKNKLNYKIITLKKILEIFLKGINIQNLKMKNYLEKENNNKMELILNYNIKKLKKYKFNLLIINYFNSIKRFISVIKIRSLLYNIRLFIPKQLLKPDPYFRYYYRLRFIIKIFQGYDFFEKRDRKIIRRQVKKLIKEGLKLKKAINYKIKLNINLIDSLLSNKNNINIIKEESLDKLTQIANLNINETQPLILNPANNLIKNLLKNKKDISLNKTNEIKIEQTINSILKNKSFDSNIDTISPNSNPVAIVYSNNNNNNNLTMSVNIQKKPIINQYLKSLSKYNLINKGIFISYSNIISFNFNTETNKLIKNIYKLLAASFKSMYCLISKPVFVITPDKIIIQLFYFLFIPNILKYKKLHEYGNISNRKLNKNKWFKRKLRIRKQYRKFKKIKVNIRIKLRKLSNVVLTKVFTNKFKILCDLLSNLFKKPVHLDLIRLHYPYNDSNILVNLLGIMINKIKLRIIFRKLFEKAVIKKFNKVTGKNNILPAFLSGIKIKVAGRLLTHRVIPRKTVKIINRGSSASGKINFSDKARYTNKNKRGSFSITVLSGQNFI